MRVFLVSANTEQIQMPVLPMGLACVAEAVVKAGHGVGVLNLMAANDSLHALESALAEFKPEVIGISVRNIDDQAMRAPRFLLDAVRGVVDVCRRTSSAPIVLGGAGYSLYPRSVLAYLGADMGIQGEGENAFRILLERLSGNGDLSDVPNLYLPGRPDPQSRAVASDLDAFPLPAPDGLLAFPDVFRREQVWLPFQTRRGCPMQCSYCSTATIEGRTLRRRDPEAAVRSIERFVDAGYSNFFFVDNTFNFPPSYAKDLCERLAARMLGIRWRCILYPWKVDEELAAKLAEAGCVEVAFGFESGSEKVLRSMNKRFGTGDIRRISALLESFGIGRMGFLLLGGPGETRETVVESLEFADSLGLESMKVTAGIRIYPYTALARIAESEGLIAPGDDLLRPVFYLAEGLDGWLQETVSRWLERNPNWHG